MDYIPVYEGEDSDDGSVKLSPGKIQRTGVRSEPAALRVIRTTVRAPGTIQLDERRVSVIALRSESFVEKVANVTTGSACRQGPAADGDLQPGDLVGRGRIHLRPSMPKPPAATGLWQGRAAAADEPRRAGSGHRRTSRRPATVPLADRLDRAARRHRARTQRHRRHAGAARRRAVPDRRSLGGLGDGRCRRTRSRARGSRASRSIVQARAAFRAGRSPERSRDLSAAQHGDPHRARPHRTAQPGHCCCHDMYVDAEIDTGSAEPVLAVPESAVLDSGSAADRDGRQGRRPLRAARGQARPPRRRLCRNPRRRWPKASRSSPPPIS